MIFPVLPSYRFPEIHRKISLNLDIPEDDPLSIAKKMFCGNNSGIRISAVEGGEEVTWGSGLAWIACVNEEDGLHFGIAQTTDGGRELETTWKGEKIQSSSHLCELLAVDPLWEIFQLRAVVLLLERLETQLAILQETEETLSNMQEDKAALDSMFRPGVFTSITQFRILEGELLERAVEELIKQVSDRKGHLLCNFPPLTMRCREQSYWLLKRWPSISTHRQGSRTNPMTFHDPKLRAQIILMGLNYKLENTICPRTH